MKLKIWTLALVLAAFSVLSIRSASAQASALTVNAIHVDGYDNSPNGSVAAVEITNAATTNSNKDWWLRVGAAGTNTPNGGFSLGNDDAYWLAITYNGNVGLGFNVKDPVHPLQMADGAYEDDKTWVNGSDRNEKENFAAVDHAQLLSKINAMPIEMWNYKSKKGVHHIGPVAQDFYAAFGLGQDDRHISTVDEGGVALAAVQELYRMVVSKDAQIQALSAKVEELQKLEQTVQLLSTRLAKIEADKNATADILRASR